MKKNIATKLLTVIAAISLLTGCATSGATIKSSEEAKDAVKAGDVINEQEEVIDTREEEQTTDEDGIGEVKDEANPAPAQGITVNQIKFEVIDISTLSEELLGEIDAVKLQKGYEFWQQEDGSFLILISSGEKMTGGYGIEVTSIEDNEGKTIISVNETEPTGDMNAQVVSYPFVVVKASGITDQFIVRDQKENEFLPMAAEGTDPATSDNGGLFDTVLRLSEDFVNPVTGIYQGQIDNHSIEVLVGDTYATFSADDIAQYLKGIEVGDKIEITQAISPSDQVTVESIKKVD